jgi:hypothetical protein
LTAYSSWRLFLKNRTKNLILCDTITTYQHYTFLHSSLAQSHKHSRLVSAQSGRFATGVNSIKTTSQKTPIFIAPGIAYPYKRAVIDASAPGLAAWVLKTFPAYDMKKHLPVYAITETAVAAQYLAQLPANITTVLAGDGINYRYVQR